MVLLVEIDTTDWERKQNSSFLFSSMRRNDCQFPGIRESGRTLLLIPLPKSNGTEINNIYEIFLITQVKFLLQFLKEIKK